jgi:hypothetical protein
MKGNVLLKKKLKCMLTLILFGIIILDYKNSEKKK